MHYEYMFTVFTPTYNRAHTLHRVYNSLVSQTFRDFEWLVVDDGSTDCTSDLLSDWSTGADFPIRSYYQPNQGKHVAFNHAVPKAKGALFLTFDSDDECVPHALETLKYHWEAIPDERRAIFSGISVLCVDHHGRIIGDSFPQQTFDSNILEVEFRWKVRGDKWGFHRTEVMQRFSFPVPPVRLSHIPEGIVWSRIARKYKTRFVNEPLLRVHYTEASLSRNRDFNQIAYRRVLYASVTLNEHLDYLLVAPLKFCRLAVNYVRGTLQLHGRVLRAINRLHNVRARILCLLLIPVAFVLRHKR